MAGEEVVIAKAGIALVRLMPVAPARRERCGGHPGDSERRYPEADSQVDANALPLGLLQDGVAELPLRAPNGLAVQPLPRVHRDSHRCGEDLVDDRLLVVQAAHEGLHLLSAERSLLVYGQHVIWIGS
jgi:hypothetical protein